MIELKVKNSSKNELPEYKTQGSSGFDLRSNLNRKLTIMPGKRAIVPTGLFMDIPEGYEIQIRPRSGLAAKYGITVLNSPGTIDSDYKDEILVILFNSGEEPFEVECGDRVAQGVLMRVDKASFVSVDEINREGDRGGGLGHTGIK